MITVNKYIYIYIYTHEHLIGPGLGQASPLKKNVYDDSIHDEICPKPRKSLTEFSIDRPIHVLQDRSWVQKSRHCLHKTPNLLF